MWLCGNVVFNLSVAVANNYEKLVNQDLLNQYNQKSKKKVKDKNKCNFLQFL
jgi:hypothetical protein